MKHMDLTAALSDPWLIPFAGLSALAAIASALLAWRANWQLQQYKDPFWVLDVATDHGMGFPGEQYLVLDLCNRGETAGRKVSISLPADPAEMHFPHREWAFIDKGTRRSFVTRFTLPAKPPFTGQVPPDTPYVLLLSNPDNAIAKVTWTTPLGVKRVRDVNLPPLEDFYPARPLKSDDPVTGAPETL